MYIINLCNEEKFDFSVDFLKEEVKRVNKLGIKCLVLHPGSHVGIGIEEGINNISKGLNLVFQNLMSKKLGDIEYEKDEYLNLGASYEEPKDNLAMNTDKDNVSLRESTLTRCITTSNIHEKNNENNYNNDFNYLKQSSKKTPTLINSSSSPMLINNQNNQKKY